MLRSLTDTVTKLLKTVNTCQALNIYPRHLLNISHVNAVNPTKSQQLLSHFTDEGVRLSPGVQSLGPGHTAPADLHAQAAWLQRP